ncbi:flagellar hook-length control protein FliK [Vitiosangium sp. GDMCC 1.1324]|uniref:flagellar hook-length control protein FliK n=1 Tax=Vitiosangium sp. (strain GDMCC 1.1324) TaxID=2138576 RepID=UPI000D395E40|nr:flagellar hook-length control protein FliK [Vitiosangium sp. GDMCC 1.1324]PTL80509.1 flagellar hook-length control protein FliK [Vitiosangium sp. GDMCC 1.1324]
MSRVEDDRQAQKAAERLVQEKRLQESKAKQRQEGESTFSKLVQQQQAAQTQQPKQPQQQQNLGKSVLARLQQEGKSGELRSQQRQTGQTAGEQGQVNQGRRQDQGVVQTRSESRTADAKVTRETQDERSEAFNKDGDNSALGAQVSRDGKGALRANADGGGGKGSGDGKDKKEGSPEMAAGFRFNPALMAPVPVAQPKPSSGSERLRAIANEIAQKIVERVRVGTNAAGNAEFQIDLRNDVLSGLSIKLTAKNGKIQAVFSGSNREVLKMLEEQRDGLKNALAGRGLTLEELRVEAKT